MQNEEDKFDPEPLITLGKINQNPTIQFLGNEGWVAASQGARDVRDPEIDPFTLKCHRVLELDCLRVVE
ncbi:hypothetical protein TSAR_008493 [Trichomalopsis sarcophagae]|uniref:Uncharacterized protein n=1 Tax=Trichomalopsis sarcophagae TaxID=543379 RepID=A0A232ESY9_9HYME|nr:hypothetical protein TSAR_008493 [Trichomalopsis sarcophagae]